MSSSESEHSSFEVLSDDSVIFIGNDEMTAITPVGQNCPVLQSPPLQASKGTSIKIIELNKKIYPYERGRVRSDWSREDDKMVSKIIIC